ncbi:MAG: peptide deformylase [Nitriliruptoraceae bacterium]|nr:peptide deformylase [Nitriliruptoraceae bacterium]
MSTMEIRIFGDPVLRQRAHEVEDFDGSLAQLAADMFDTMRAAEGVGLAANQVGVLKRLFTWEVVTETPEGDLVPEGSAIVNPVLHASSEEIQDGDEGCLSFPGLFYPVQRPLTVEVAYQDLGGAAHEVTLEGFLARVWLHEMDHLNGILFIDHLAKHDKQAALKAMRERDQPAPPRPGSLLLGRGD